MITSKQRAYLRALATDISPIMQIGKGGITENVIAEAERLLDARELVKGKVLETALMDPREVSDSICEATGADGVQIVGTKFVIYRRSERLEQERRAKEKAARKVNPVRAGVQARRRKAKDEQQKKKEYFREAAVKAAIERRKEREGEI